MRRLVQAVAVVAAAAAFHLLVVLPWRGNLALRAMLQSSVLAQRSDPQVGVIIARQNVAALESVKAGRRLDPTWYMLYGANCEVLDRLADAEAAYSGALRIDDRPELYVNRATVRLHLGRTDEAVADLAQAARFDPAVLQQFDGEVRTRAAAAAGLPPQ